MNDDDKTGEEAAEQSAEDFICCKLHDIEERLGMIEALTRDVMIDQRRALVAQLTGTMEALQSTPPRSAGGSRHHQRNWRTR